MTTLPKALFVAVSLLERREISSHLLSQASEPDDEEIIIEPPEQVLDLDYPEVVIGPDGIPWVVFKLKTARLH